MSKSKRQNRKCEPKISQMDRQGWKSLLVVIGEILLTCILACGIPYGVYLYYQHLVGTGYFEPHKKTVQGNLRVDDMSILEASGLMAEGVNLFEIDVHTIEAGIETLPWIKKAKVRVDLPDSVEIEVTEHHPLGLVNDGQLFVVDEAGEAIKNWSPDDSVMAPIVTLDKPLDTQKRAVVGAFKLAESIKKAGYSRPLEEIHYDDATGYTLYSGMTEIRLGYDRFEERLERLQVVEDVLAKKNVDAAYILLDADTTLDRIVVRPIVRAPEPVDKAESMDPDGTDKQTSADGKSEKKTESVKSEKSGEKKGVAETAPAKKKASDKKNNKKAQA